MFGIWNASVRIAMRGGVVAKADIVPGHWNPGMYSDITRADVQEFREAERKAASLAPLMVGRKIMLGDGRTPLSDGVYDFTLQDCENEL